MLAGNPNQKSANGIFVYECHPNADGSGAIVGPNSFSRIETRSFPLDYRLETVSILIVRALTGEYQELIIHFLSKS